MQAGEDIDEAELEAAACAMGYGAVKYADLRNSRLTNYKFSFDTMLALNGNTAVYLLYAHARIAGIVRKSGRDVEALLAEGKAVQLDIPREGADKGHLQGVYTDRVHPASASTIQSCDFRKLAIMPYTGTHSKIYML